MALQIIRNNIINVEADAIVNTANPGVGVGRGVDCAIYKAAGWERLLEARRKIGVMEPGQAAFTPAFDLHAKYIIHTVGPAWRGGGCGERETVAKCYSASLSLAKELGCESVAFPLIATGTYGFPKDEALRIAMAEISSFLLENEMEVLLVVYDRESFEVSGKLFSDIRSFIEEPFAEESKSVSGRMDEERPLLSRGMNRRQHLFGRIKEHAMEAGGAIEREKSKVLFDEDMAAAEPDSMDTAEVPAFAPLSEAAPGDFSVGAFPSAAGSLEERIEHMDKTFQEYLFMLIDRRGLEDPDVYKKANIDRKHFSKIRSNKDYKPGKKTALALAIALELSLDETRDLLARAGLTLSPSIISDLIIEYCIENGNYDIYEINCILFKYDQPTLGA